MSHVFLTEEVMFSPVSICWSVGTITQKLPNRFPSGSAGVDPSLTVGADPDENKDPGILVPRSETWCPSCSCLRDGVRDFLHILNKCPLGLEDEMTWFEGSKVIVISQKDKEMKLRHFQTKVRCDLMMFSYSASQLRTSRNSLSLWVRLHVSVCLSVSWANTLWCESQ